MTRENADYIIIESIQATEEVEYVLGQHKNNPDMYVTWRCAINGNDYYGGEYCNSLLQAKKSLYQRALTSVNYLLPVSEDTVADNAIVREIHAERIDITLTPEEMDHIWDVVSQENIVNDIKFRLGQREDFPEKAKEYILNENANLIDEIGQKFRSDGGMFGESHWYMIDSYIDEKINYFRMPRFSEVPVYKETWSYACLNGEREEYNRSLQETLQCRDDMQKDISEHFDGFHIPIERTSNYILDYGYERVMIVLANTIQQNEWDARISRDNKEWAKTIAVPDTERNARRMLLSCGTGLVDGITREVRRLYETEQQNTINHDALAEDDECDMEI